MEGGILHYFHDIDEFMKIMNSIMKKVYEEYSADGKKRFFVIDEGAFYSVRVEYYYPENEIEG